MQLLLNFIATVCLIVLGCFFFVAMQGFASADGAGSARPRPESLSLPASSLAGARPVVATAPLAAETPAASPVETAASLRRVHVGRRDASLAVLLDFSGVVDFRTDYEASAHRLGVRISPVDRSSLAVRIEALKDAFGPIEVQSASDRDHELWLTLGEGIAPSRETRTASGQDRSLVLAFEVSGPDPAAELPSPVESGRLSDGRKATIGRGYNFYEYRWLARDGSGSDVFVHRVDSTRGDFDVGLALARDRIHARQPLSDMARARGAAGGINAGYFAIHGNGDPLGLLVSAGRLLAAPIFARSAIGLFPGGRVLFGNPELSGRVILGRSELGIDGLNQAREPEKLLLYTHDYGSSTGTEGPGFEASVAGGRVLAVGECDLPIPPDGYVLSKQGALPGELARLRPGDPIAYQYGLTPPWNSSLVAVGGGPRLLERGLPVRDYEAERFTRQFAMTRAPRTGVGLTATGKLLLVAVDGRRRGVDAGVSLPELSDIFRSLGATDALNMDGGGSTTCWIAGRTVNSPSDRRERPISSALLVLKRAPANVAAAGHAGDQG
ncbi:MAG: phosphodiester glycosidase family protein [Candidatus Wallbacteria bacterium]|nr:phosphodiester glycosidase family protein [Candidatus Wallbacteria bacterium]